MKKVLDFIKRLLIYLVGLLIIALGINVSKMSGLGISPVSSIPGVLNAIWPQLTLGMMVILVYCLLVLAQVVVLRKDFKLKNVLGVPVAIVFGWMVDLVGIDEKTFGHLLSEFPKPQEWGVSNPGIVYMIQFAYLVVSILVIAVGVYIYLKPKLVPMPAEGLALAISQKINKPFGNCKTAVDVSLIVIALALQIVLVLLLVKQRMALEETPVFRLGDLVVREGTVLAAVCVGQVVKLLNRMFGKKH